MGNQKYRNFFQRDALVGKICLYGRENIGEWEYLVVDPALLLQHSIIAL